MKWYLEDEQRKHLPGWMIDYGAHFSIAMGILILSLVMLEVLGFMRFNWQEVIAVSAIGILGIGHGIKQLQDRKDRTKA